MASGIWYIGKMTGEKSICDSPARAHSPRCPRPPPCATIPAAYPLYPYPTPYHNTTQGRLAYGNGARTPGGNRPGDNGSARRAPGGSPGRRRAATAAPVPAPPPTPTPPLDPITMKSLLESGVHFGHQTRRWNPKMRRYIFTQRNGIHIIDLQQTMGLIAAAYRSIMDISANGGKVLFVGTKKQAQDVIASEAERTDNWYVNQRWLGGTLTNFQTIRTRIDHMKRLQEQRDSGYLARLPKKEVVRLTHTLDKLEKYFTGLRNMNQLPAASSSSTSAKRTSASPKPADSTSPSSPSWTPTATRASSPTPSPATTTPSAPSASSPDAWPPPSRKDTLCAKPSSSPHPNPPTTRTPPPATMCPPPSPSRNWAR